MKVPGSWCRYTDKPSDAYLYTEKMNRMYSSVAKAYDGFIKLVPFWSTWLETVLPYVQGKKILEVSFGPGYLLTRYPVSSKVYGLDYNKIMVNRAKVKVSRVGMKANLIQGDVVCMPYPDNYFDTVVNTMAFSGYPNGEMALSEMLRVLRLGGTLVLLDYDYPLNRNVMGFLMVRFIEICGDIIKDIGALVEEEGKEYQRITIGAWGSVQLFIIKK